MSAAMNTIDEPIEEPVDDLEKVVEIKHAVNIGPTVLGCEVRRDTIGIVNGVSNGIFIEVRFLGTRAYTNGRKVVLPKIKDLAEIRYSTARALIGYAIHEVAHIRYTDFKAINRIYTDPTIVAAFGTDDKKEIVQRQKLIKKLENCIEDYRIEREMTREYPGTKSDLEALRIAIHPKLKTLTTGWFADPRSCGPLALTWLGASINGFQNPHLDRTLSHMPEPVLALIIDWSERMVDVADTAGVVDLAIAFELEAQELARAMRELARRQKAVEDALQGKDIDPSAAANDAPDGTSGDGDAHAADEAAEDEPSHGDEDAPADADDDAGDHPVAASDPNPSAADQDDVADDERRRDPKDQSDAIDEALRDQEDGSPLDQDAERTDAPADAPHNAASDDHDGAADEGTRTDAGSAGPDAEDHRSEAGDRAENEQSIDFGGDRREKQKTLQRMDDPKGAPSKERKGENSPSDDAKVDLNGDLVDDYVDPSLKPDPDAEGGSENRSVPESRPDGDGQRVEGKGIDGHSLETDQDDGDAVDEIESSEEDAEGDAPRHGGADEVGDTCDTGGADDGMDSGTGGGAFDDVLDEDARMDDAISDMIEDMHDRIAAGETIPEMTPDADDGEVDPSSLLDEISETNEDAPDYDSSDSDPNPFDMSDEDTRALRASLHYGDARFSNAPEGGEDGCRHEEMRQKSAGATSTTARTIKRLLMAEERSGFLVNRRSGEFDIRNVSAIARNTGTCYRRNWTRPAPETLLVTLVDFSMSMEGDEKDERDLESPIAIAMTGALAIEQAVKGTSVNSAMYGFTGASPTVNLTVFKEGRQRETITRRRIGSYGRVSKCCTPTGEAMAAVAARMDKATEKRRILLVLTDGDADNAQLCADVTNVLIRRGIEVVVIGIQNDSAEGWAPVHRTIHNLSDLPAALLATIDPRAGKRRGRKLAA
jgi:hypothetical protein